MLVESVNIPRYFTCFTSSIASLLIRIHMGLRFVKVCLSYVNTELFNIVFQDINNVFLYFRLYHG